VPFPDESVLRKLDGHRNQEPESMRSLRPEIPAELAAVVARMTAKRPAARFQTPAEVAAALAHFVRGTYPARKRSRTSALVAAAALFAAVVAGAGVVYRIQTDNGEVVITPESPDVEIVLAKGGREVEVIDTKTKKRVRVPTGVYDVQIKNVPDGIEVKHTDRIVVSRGKEALVTIEKAAKAPLPLEGKVGEVRRFEGHEGPVRAVAYSPDGRYALSGSGWPNGDRTVRLWDLAAGKEIRLFKGHAEQVLSVAFSPDGRRVLSGGADRTARLWDVQSGKEIRRFEGHGDSIVSLAFSPDGRCALSGSVDRTARLWDVDTGNEIRKFETGGWVVGVAFSPDGSRAFSASNNGIVHAWEVETGKELQSYRGTRDAISHAVACSPNGRLVVFGDATKLVLWNVETGKVVREFGSGATSVAFSPDGRRVLSGSGKVLQIWDVETGKQVHRFEGHLGGIWSVAFSPDGRHAISGSADWTVRLWRLPDPPPPEKVGEVRCFEGHTGPIRSVAYSPDGRYLLSGSGWPNGDRTVRLWDAATGKELRQFVGHADQVFAVAFSPDSRRAVSAGHDYTIFL
jgi:WD40 repeat protein